MKLEWYEDKRAWTLAARGIDFADAAIVFRGVCVTFPDQRLEYGERRFITFGKLKGRLLAICWTPRGDAVRIISMRKANAREQRFYQQRLAEDRRHH